MFVSHLWGRGGTRTQTEPEAKPTFPGPQGQAGLANLRATNKTKAKRSQDTVTAVRTELLGTSSASNTTRFACFSKQPEPAAPHTATNPRDWEPPESCSPWCLRVSGARGLCPAPQGRPCCLEPLPLKMKLETHLRSLHCGRLRQDDSKCKANSATVSQNKKLRSWGFSSVA